MLPRFNLVLTPSWLLVIFLGLIYISTVISLIMLNFSGLLKFILALLILSHGVLVIRSHGLLISHDSIVEVNFDDAIHVWLVSSCGEMIEAILLGSTWISASLIILNFRTQQKLMTTVLIMPDSISKQQWRRLRAFLLVYR